MKKLSVLTEDIRGGDTKTTVVGRGKLIIESSEDRPSYIEIDNYEKIFEVNKPDDNEPEIRINFGDNTNYKGSIDKLNKDLKLAKLSKKLMVLVKTGDDYTSVIEQMITISKSTLEYNFVLEQGYKQRIEELTNVLKQVHMAVEHIPDELFYLVDKTLNK